MAGKKRSTGLKVFSVLLAISLLTACQPTPDEQIIVGKDQEAMLSAAVETHEYTDYNITALKAPKSYRFSAQGADGKLTVHTDAAVTLPEAETLPIAKVVPGGFTQEMVSGMLAYLYGDEPYYLTDSSVVMTKGEIESAIVSMQASIADDTYADDPETLAVVQQQLEALNKQYDSAPETRDEPVRSDGMMTVNTETGASSISVHSINNDDLIFGGALFDCYSSTDISTAMDADTSYLDYHNYISEDDDYIAYTMDGAIRVDDDSDIPDTLRAKLGLTLTEAKQLVQGLLDAAEVDDMHCGAAYVVDDHGTGNIDGYTGPASDYAIKLCYSRSVNGSPVLTLGELGQTTGSEYDYIWMYEAMEVLVTDGGIIEITWNNPCDVSEIVTENTNIMGFEQAADIFEDKILTFYEGKLDRNEEFGCESVDVGIDSVELGLLRIKQQNTEGTKAGLYVPVWAYYGTVVSQYFSHGAQYTSYNGGSAFPDGPYIVAAINAVDGSIIDIDLGY